MFDVAKLKQILQLVAKFSGSSLTQSVMSILDQYEGMYVGLGMHSNSETTTDSTTDTQNSEQTQQQSGLGSLIQILSGGKKK